MNKNIFSEKEFEVISNTLFEITHKLEKYNNYLGDKTFSELYNLALYFEDDIILKDLEINPADKIILDSSEAALLFKLILASDIEEEIQTSILKKLNERY